MSSKVGVYLVFRESEREREREVECTLIFLEPVIFLSLDGSAVSECPSTLWESLSKASKVIRQRVSASSCTLEKHLSFPQYRHALNVSSQCHLLV